MGFMDAYKELEKLCSEIYQENHGVSSYIDDMYSKSNSGFYVPGWQDDLKNLKHYRWVRNKIVHEPGCTQENMCQSKDERWIRDFCSRIRNGEDPLTQYRIKKESGRYVSRPPQQEETAKWEAVFLTVVIVVLTILIMAVLFTNIF